MREDLSDSGVAVPVRQSGTVVLIRAANQALSIITRGRKACDRRFRHSRREVRRIERLERLSSPPELSELSFPTCPGPVGT
jgi:hypothetical protein